MTILGLSLIVIGFIGLLAGLISLALARCDSQIVRRYSAISLGRAAVSGRCGGRLRLGRLRVRAADRADFLHGLDVRQRARRPDPGAQCQCPGDAGSGVVHFPDCGAHVRGALVG